MKHWYRDTVFSHIAQPYTEYSAEYSDKLSQNAHPLSSGISLSKNVKNSHKKTKTKHHSSKCHLNFLSPSDLLSLQVIFSSGMEIFHFAVKG